MRYVSFDSLNKKIVILGEQYKFHKRKTKELKIQI